MTDSVRASGTIEGLDRIKMSQPTFSLGRRPRPPPIEVFVAEEESRQARTSAPLHRQQSKGGIRSIFNRNKLDKSTMPSTSEEGEPQPDLSKYTSNSGLETPATPGKSMSKPSRMNLRGRAAKETKTPSRQAPKPTLKSSPVPARASTVWDPPPLFQAYPQAIKHAQLSASTMSADSILRISHHKRNNSLTEYNPTATEAERGQTAKKTEKSRSKHRRQISGSLSKADWTQKIFVLVTSGYLLQYSGDGSFDRLPEKMMQLGKDSVAFASDVIPGKHWVLQVSQSMDADGTPSADSRSLLSRLTFRGGADYRRTATSLLLVLESVEEMESWLIVLRREIESLGGKKHVPDIARQRSDERIHRLANKTSHRYLVAKVPDNFTTLASSAPQPPDPTSWSRSNSLQRDTEEVASSIEWTHPPPRPATSHESGSNSVISHDGRRLDDLRDSNRFSYVSSGQRTVVSTHFSSPEPSPTRESSLTTFGDGTPKMSMEEVQGTPRPNASAISERRRSMQTSPIIRYDSPTASKMQRHSTYGPPSATPNFSVPNSSSRRYSSVKSTTSAGSNGSITTRSSDPALRGARKTPPPAITIARPLSPVVDDGSPTKQQDSAVTSPTGSSYESLQQVTASVVDITPCSPLPEPSPVKNTHLTPANAPFQRNSLKSIREAGTAHLDFEFPKRPTSMVDTTPNKIKRTSFLSFNKRHSLASPERHSHTPHQGNLSPMQESAPSSPITATLRTKLGSRPTSLKARPLSVTPSRPMTNSTFSTTSPSTSPSVFAFPRRAPSVPTTQVTSSPSTPPIPVRAATTAATSRPTRPPPAAPKPHSHLSTSPAPSLPTKSELRPRIPSLQKLRTEEGKKALNNRRSMPFLVGGPPPAPPPDCALPALPPMAGSMGKRVSMKA